MEVFDIEKALETLTIVVDTREQPSERAQRRYEQFSCPYKRQKLNYGDYAAELLINDTPVIINACIERKMNLEELSNCFTQDRKRFKAEMERMTQDNATMYLLVENASWEKILNGAYKTKFNKKAFLASIVSWMIRYNFKPIFCKSEVSGKLINEILYRECKLRLERGDYD